MDSFGLPRQFARTRPFSLGVPRGFTARHGQRRDVAAHPAPGRDAGRGARPGRGARGVHAARRTGALRRISEGPGVHAAAVGGDTVVLDSRAPDGQTVTVLRGGEPAGRRA
ncbi:hypothetical protein [Streptomyces sp. NPDC003006]